MKRLFTIFIVICFTITYFSSCFRYNETDFLCDCGKIEISKKEYIAICVVPEEVTTTSVNFLRIENHTREKIEYRHSSGWAIEYFDKDHWELVVQFPFTEIGSINILAGETEKRIIDFFALAEEHNKGKKGRYRNIQYATLDNTSYTLISEFEVK